MTKQIPFSQRFGARTPNQIGMNQMPMELRVSLWNIIQPWIWQERFGEEYKRRAAWIYNSPLTRWPTDEIPSHFHSHKTTERLKNWFLVEAAWDQVYEFVETLPEVIWCGVGARSSDPRELMNRNMDAFIYVRELVTRYTSDLDAMLEREGSPYRYRGIALVQVTNEDELAEVEQALSETPFQGARTHIEAAARLLSQRIDPDFRNSIKESISAVESLLQEATGMKGEKLPKLLDAFEAKYRTDMHGAFKAALGSLYGWTSDDGAGIRHGIFGTETVGRAEAQFMLVSCSALVNLLVAKAQ